LERFWVGTSAKTAGEAEPTRTLAITLAATAVAFANTALIVEFSSIVLPPILSRARDRVFRHMCIAAGSQRKKVVSSSADDVNRSEPTVSSF
jgi:hypothetical protein